MNVERLQTNWEPILSVLTACESRIFDHTRRRLHFYFLACTLKEQLPSLNTFNVTLIGGRSTSKLYSLRHCPWPTRSGAARTALSHAWGFKPDQVLLAITQAWPKKVKADLRNNAEAK